MSKKMNKGRLSGRVLSGRFKLEALLEGGLTGEVYQAVDLAGGDRVTVAVFGGGPLKAPDRLNELSRKVQGLFDLDQVTLGAIISQHLSAESRKKGEHPYLVFADQDGTPLDAFIRDEGPLNPEMASFILLQVAMALEALHARGSCHGGLSAGRVRVRPEHLLHDDYVKVHLPVVSGALLSAAINLLEEDEPLTTGETARLPYAAPEALLDEAPTAAADIYAAGALLYLCLTDKAPIPRDADDADAAGLRDAMLFNSPPPIAELSPDLPSDLLKLVTRSLAKDLDERPASAAELCEVLARHAPEPAITGCGVKEPPTPATEAPPIKPILTPVAFSLGDAQRQASLSRAPTPRPERQAPAPQPPLPSADIQLDAFNTIAMAAPPRMMEQPEDLLDTASAKEPEGPPIPDDFPTIAMPSPGMEETAPSSPPEKVSTVDLEPQPELQPAGTQTEDFSTVLLSMDELEQEADEAPPETAPNAEEPEADLDPDDAMFHSVELKLEDVQREPPKNRKS